MCFIEWLKMHYVQIQKDFFATELSSYRMKLGFSKSSFCT